MRWRQWLRRPAMTREERERDIAREIRAHLQAEEDAAREGGLSTEEARQAAERAFGNVATISEDIRAVWIDPAHDALVQDVRYALRTMRRAPGFLVVAAGSIALGVAACTVVFAVLNASRLRPLPVESPGRLLSLSESDRRAGGTGNELSYPDLLDLRESRALDGVAAAHPLLPASLGWRGEPQRHWGALVTANYFAVVRPSFALGRGFDAIRDDQRGELPVVVLGYDLWQRLGGGDPAFAGRRMSINGRPATVIGVTAAGFHGTDPGIMTEFWIPFSMIDEVESRLGPVSQNRDRHWLRAVGRLSPGKDVRAARAEVDLVAQRLNARYRAGDADRGFALERAGQADPRLRHVAMPLFAVGSIVCVLILLTTCANVANLLLGRAFARRHEIAARMALGASRARLVRQLLTESLLLALMGGVAGGLLAVRVTSLLGVVRTPLGWPLDLSIALDSRVLVFGIGLSVVTAVAFGLVPAVRATRSDLIADLKGGGQQGATRIARFGLRSGLAVAQVTTCTVLLLTMGLFLRSYRATRVMDLGIEARHLLLLGFDPALDHRLDEESRRLLRDVLERARAVPGVESATLTTGVPLTLVVNNSEFVPEERASDPAAPHIGADIYHVGPRFFATMGIPFLVGDDFGFAGKARAGAVIVNEAFARAAFSGGSPLGRRIVGDGRSLEVVGLVRTAKSRTIGEAPRSAIYLPILDEYSAATTPRGVTLVVKTRDLPAGQAARFREVIREADGGLAVFDVRTMESHLRDALIVPRLAVTLAGVAGGIGLAIAAIGVYGVIRFAVVRRRRELGIRLAVGARPREILTMIFRQGLALALLGTALGLVAFIPIARFATSLLYGISPADGITLLTVPLFLMAVAVVACLLPARAAARLNPVEVLRSH